MVVDAHGIPFAFSRRPSIVSSKALCASKSSLSKRRREKTRGGGEQEEEDEICGESLQQWKSTGGRSPLGQLLHLNRDPLSPLIDPKGPARFHYP